MRESERVQGVDMERERRSSLLGQVHLCGPRRIPGTRVRQRTGHCATTTVAVSLALVSAAACATLAPAPAPALAACNAAPPVAAYAVATLFAFASPVRAVR